MRPRTTRHRPAFVEHRLQEPVVSYGGLRAGLRSNTMHCSQSPIGDSKYLIRRELGRRSSLTTTCSYGKPGPGLTPESLCRISRVILALTAASSMITPPATTSVHIRGPLDSKQNIHGDSNMQAPSTKLVQLSKGNSSGDTRRAMPSIIMVAPTAKLTHTKELPRAAKPNASGEIMIPAPSRPFTPLAIRPVDMWRGLIRIRFDRQISQMGH